MQVKQGQLFCVFPVHTPLYNCHYNNALLYCILLESSVQWIASKGNISQHEVYCAFLLFKIDSMLLFLWGAYSRLLLKPFYHVTSQHSYICYFYALNLVIEIKIITFFFIDWVDAALETSFSMCIKKRKIHVLFLKQFTSLFSAIMW